MYSVFFGKTKIPLSAACSRRYKTKWNIQLLKLQSINTAAIKSDSYSDPPWRHFMIISALILELIPCLSLSILGLCPYSIWSSIMSLCKDIIKRNIFVKYSNLCNKKEKKRKNKNNHKACILYTKGKKVLI